MKNFLKSTAIFAFAALLFCACSEDTTEDTTLPSVDASGIRSVTPGNGKFEIRWVVAPDDQITICRVSWSNADETTTGEWVVAADFTDVMEYTTTTTLPAGEYTVTLENYGDDEIDSKAVSRTITVYDSTSFTSPTIIGAAVESASEGVNVLFEWDSIPEDCTGVFMTYTTAGGDDATTKLISFNESAFIEGVESGSSYSYTTCFKPEDGLDEVMYVNKDAGTVPSVGAAPSDPTSVTVNSGDYKFQVSAGSAVGGNRAVVKYDNGNTTYYKYIDVESAGEFVALVEELPLETYAVSMRYISGETMSSEVAGDSDAAVYDLTAYTESCSFPAYISMYHDNEFKSTATTTEFSQPYCINWSENPDCYELLITYTTSANGDYREDVDITAAAVAGSTTTIYDIMPGSEYQANVTFRPSVNGLDRVVKSQVMQAPYAPVPKFIYSWGGSKGTTRYRHYFINPIGDDSDCTGTGPNDDKGSKLIGEATLQSYGITNYFFEELFDNAYDYSTNSTSMYRRQYNADATYTQVDQTVSYDLGATFQLKTIIYTPHLAQGFGGTTLKQFSLYGSNDNPLTTTGLDIATADTEAYVGTEFDYMAVPDLSNWECLLDNVEILKPSGNNIDYNGDGVVDTDDDTDYICDGISFDIPTTASAVRYLRLQYHSTFGGTNQFWIMELDHTHSNCVSNYDGEAYQDNNVLNTNVGAYYPGIVRSDGVVLTISTDGETGIIYNGTEVDGDE